MLSQSELKEVIHYDPLTGVFTRIKKTSNSVKTGNLAGCFDKGNGYIRIRVNSKLYQAHRLAWLYMMGEFPKQMIDHKDGNKTNNAFSNLREADSSQNALNSKILATNKSGYKGVGFHKKTGMWRARAVLNKVVHYLGLFETAQLAANAYKEFAEKNHGNFYRETN